MPWLGHAPDAPDTHRMWADSGSQLEASLKASGWCHEVPAPGSEPPPANDPPADPAPTEKLPVEQKPRRITRRKT